MIRSALESLAVLVYLNQLTERVLSGSLDFHDFSSKTGTLLMGSRDGSTSRNSLNIVTVLDQCEKKYPGIGGIYATLSECAHPNYEGVTVGYSEVDPEQYQTNYSNRWQEMWADRHDSLTELICKVFESEYNDVWSDLFVKLERWIEENDATLEATK